MRAVILAGGQGVRLRPPTCAVTGRAHRFDERSLAINHIERLEDVWTERRA